MESAEQMSQADVLTTIQSTLGLALELSAPVLAFGLIVGIVVSLFQAVTQINDSTLALVPKILSVFLALALFGPWMFHQMIHFAVQMLTRLPGSGA